MGKRYVFFCGILIACVLLQGQEKFNINQRWVNPEGWKRPDVSRIVKSGEKAAILYGHGDKIVISTYDPAPDQPYTYFDKKIGLEEDRYLVYLDCEVRAEIQRIHVYQDQNGKVLLYFINCMMPERVVAHDNINGLYNAGYSTAAEQYILVDLDQDGKFESQFSETAAFWNDVTLQGIPDYFRTNPEKAKGSVVYNLLQIKMNGTPKGKTAHPSTATGADRS